MKTLTIPATLDQLDPVLDFVNSQLEEHECSMKVQMQMAIAVEELYVNIAKYAYASGGGEAEIACAIAGDTPTVTVQFTDSGVPYDPLAKEDPDTTLSAEERDIGGLGIYMVKKSMDDVTYRYEDGKNILVITKKL